MRTNHGFVLIEAETGDEYLCKGKALPVGSISPNGKLKKIQMKPAKWGPNPDYKDPKAGVKAAKQKEKAMKDAAREQKRKEKDAAREQKRKERAAKLDAQNKTRNERQAKLREEVQPKLEKLFNEMAANSTSVAKPLDVPTTPSPIKGLDRSATLSRLNKLGIRDADLGGVIPVVTGNGITYATDGHALIAVPTGWENEEHTLPPIPKASKRSIKTRNISAEQMKGIIPRANGSMHTFKVGEISQVLKATALGIQYSGAPMGKLIVGFQNGEFVMQGTSSTNDYLFTTPQVSGTPHDNKKKQDDMVANFNPEFMQDLLSGLKPTDSIRIQAPVTPYAPMRMDLADGTTMLLMPMRPDTDFGSTGEPPRPVDKYPTREKPAATTKPQLKPRPIRNKSKAPKSTGNPPPKTVRANTQPTPTETPKKPKKTPVGDLPKPSPQTTSNMSTGLEGFDGFDVDDSDYQPTQHIQNLDSLAKLTGRIFGLRDASPNFKPDALKLIADDDHGRKGIYADRHGDGGRNVYVNTHAKTREEAEKIGRKLRAGLVGKRSLGSQDMYLFENPIHVGYDGGFITNEPKIKKSFVLVALED